MGPSRELDCSAKGREGGKNGCNGFGGPRRLETEIDVKTNVGSPANRLLGDNWQFKGVQCTTSSIVSIHILSFFSCKFFFSVLFALSFVFARQVTF